MNDFDHVTVAKHRVDMEGARHHLAVALDRDRAIGQRQRFDQTSHREAVGKGTRLAVYRKLHVAPELFTYVNWRRKPEPS